MRDLHLLSTFLLFVGFCWFLLYAGAFFGLYPLRSITENGSLVEADPWLGFICLCISGSFLLVSYSLYKFL